MSWKRLLLLVALLGLAWGLAELRDRFSGGAARGVQPPAASGAASSAGSAESVAELHRQQRSGVMVETVGEVLRLLADDREGSRHQRFILRLPNDHTLLVSHNIDLAPRVPLEEGHEVQLRGQYEWNERGGVVHWTHHDPQRRRSGGWIRHHGTLYE